MFPICGMYSGCPYPGNDIYTSADRTETTLSCPPPPKFISQQNTHLSISAYA